MSTRKNKDVRAAAQVTDESDEKKTPEATGDEPVVASTRGNLWIMLLLLLPLTLCITWGALTR